MPALVTVDARDAGASQLRGWGRYSACLADALAERPREGLELDLLLRPSRGPEVAFEQLGLPLRLHRRHSDLVHATNCFLPLVRPCPGVVTIHDLAFEAWPEDFPPRTRQKYRVITPRAARSAQRVIVPSDFTREDLCRRYRIDPGKIRIIPYAPALPVGNHTPPPGPYVLAIGDLRKKKNLGTLVQAFAALHRSEELPHRLVLVGVDSGEAERLRATAGEAPVELTGYIDDDQLDALLRGAQVLVHPSRYEGFGLVLLEAMTRGVPVIFASGTALDQTAGTAAVSFEGEASDAVDQLRDALGRVLRDAELRSELSRQGREHAAGFSWSRVATATVEVYRELV